MIIGLTLLEISTYLVSTLLVVKSLDDIRLDASSKGYIINRYRLLYVKDNSKTNNSSKKPSRRAILTLLPFIPGINILSALYASTTFKKEYLEDYEKADALIELKPDELKTLESLETRSEKLNHLRFLERYCWINEQPKNEIIKEKDESKEENEREKEEPLYDIKKSLYSSNSEINAVPYEEPKGPTLRKKL